MNANPMTLTPSLVDMVRQRSKLVPTPAMQGLCDHLLASHGDAVEAVLFYGSCLHRGQELEGLVDLYLLVSNYRRFYETVLPAIFNKLLPPNVYYTEWTSGDQTVRAKYAVVSVADFERGTSVRWHHSYLWGRFAQPAALLYARDEQAEQHMAQCLAQAVMTFVRRVVPQLPPRFTSRQLWMDGLRLSYRTELRSEKPHRAAALYEASADYLDRLAAEALASLPHTATLNTAANLYQSRLSAQKRRRSQLAWTLRRVQGKLLSVLRLLKAVFTFRGGFDYILWKIERHSGVSVHVSPFARRYPLLAGWGVIWRLYRRGAFR